jgi:glucosamine-6-phosphate deaminase
MALTVGVRTIMEAKEVILVVTGQGKAQALSQMIEGGINHMVS